MSPRPDTRPTVDEIEATVKEAVRDVYARELPEPASPTPETTNRSTTMRKYMRLPDVVEAITLDELIQIGVRHQVPEVPLHNGMPWSFTYEGYPVTHENDDCYLISTPTGTVRFNRGDRLILNGASGELTTCPDELFARLYRAVDVAASTVAWPNV